MSGYSVDGKGLCKCWQHVGYLIARFGWYGFNCGSTLGLSDTGTGQLAAHVAMNTTVAAATGGLPLSCNFECLRSDWHRMEWPSSGVPRSFSEAEDRLKLV